MGGGEVLNNEEVTLGQRKQGYESSGKFNGCSSGGRKYSHRKLSCSHKMIIALEDLGKNRNYFMDNGDKIYSEAFSP